jgi:hypothetical protein
MTRPSPGRAVEYCLTASHHTNRATPHHWRRNAARASYHDMGEEIGLPPARTPAVSRRALLGGAVSAVALGGCARERPPVPAPRPDVAVLTAAIAAEQRLITLYEAALRAHEGLAGRLKPLLAHHREHLEALRRHYLPGTGEATATASPEAPPEVPGKASQALELLRRAEGEAAAARAEDVQRVAPGVAQLLASIGACEAGHAAVLSEDEE